MDEKEIETKNREAVGRYLAELPEPPVALEPEVERDAYQAITKAKKFSLSDAMSEHARRLKRNLMIWASVAVLVTYYQIKLTQIPWLQISMPDDSAAITPLIAFAPLAYSLVSFYIQALADLQRWRTTFDAQLFRATFNVLHRLNRYLNEIDQAPKKGTVWVHQYQLLEQRMKVVTRAAELAAQCFIDTTRRASRVTRLTILQAYGWELGVPLLVGILAAIYAAPSAWNALLSLIRMARNAT